MPSSSPDPQALWALCLCADWCTTCRQWRAAHEQLALEHPQLQWRWIDIEDEAELLDELDVETFPTLLLARGADVLFFGPVLPHAEGVSRLIADRAAPGSKAITAPAEALDFWRRFRAQA
jgi:thioredoxin 1